MNYEIVTDSCANLPDRIIDQFGIPVVSLTFHMGGIDYPSYVKGQLNDFGKLYENMRKGETITTSQVSEKACRDVFEKILREGKDLLYIGFSSALSGTYGVASMVIQELSEAYPERIIVPIDSLCASMGQGLLVYGALLQKQKGSSLDDLVDWVLDNRLKVCHWFTVDDLKYLKRGGRISPATALVGSLLGIKPIMHVDDEGRLIAVGKVRGRRQAVEALAEEMKKTALTPSGQTVFISHADCLQDVRTLEKILRDTLGVKEIVIGDVDPVIGAHSGPGTLALFFLGSHR